MDCDNEVVEGTDFTLSYSSATLDVGPVYPFFMEQREMLCPVIFFLEWNLTK